MCDYLLDTDSQVTTITKSFYTDNLCGQQIHSLQKLLEMEGVNGQNVPYLGYVELTITFLKDFVGVNTKILTLALIVPDLPSTLVLIGTYTLGSFTLKQNLEGNLGLVAKCVVAELKAVQSVYSEERSDYGSKIETIPKSILEFNFSDSPIPLEWKSRLTEQLQGMPEVFSLHPLDFGCTTKVKHQINLMDEMPFKHRMRPIHSEVLEAVKIHLQELLDAGII